MDLDKLLYPEHFLRRQNRATSAELRSHVISSDQGNEFLDSRKKTIDLLIASGVPKGSAQTYIRLHELVVIDNSFATTTNWDESLLHKWIKQQQSTMLFLPNLKRKAIEDVLRDFSLRLKSIILNSEDYQDFLIEIRLAGGLKNISSCPIQTFLRTTVSS